MFFISLFSPKSIRLNQREDIGIQGSIVFCAICEDVIREVLVGEPEGASEGVLDEVLDEAAGEIIFTFGDAVA